MAINLSLVGLRAVVGGASQGLGLAVAQELAASGAEVVLLARNREKLERVVADLPASGKARHSYHSVDFDDEPAVRAMAADLAEGPVTHILVNNSGGPPPGSICDAPPEQFIQAFARHVVAYQILTQAVLPGMRESGYGRIINIISTSVILPIRGLGVSNTIRAAVANWGRTLADEVGRDGITVNNVLPGMTRTERLESLFKHRAEQIGISIEQVEHLNLQAIPARRFGKPEDLAGVVAFLASPAGAYISGVNLPVDGGRLAVQG